MTDVWNLKINERSMYNGWTYESLQEEMKIVKLKRRIWFIPSNKYENWQNCE